MNEKSVVGCMISVRDAFSKSEFVNGVRDFIEFPQQNHKFKYAEKIRCPCFRCNNKRFFGVDIVTEHPYKKGFCHDLPKLLIVK